MCVGIKKSHIKDMKIKHVRNYTYEEVNGFHFSRYDVTLNMLKDYYKIYLAIKIIIIIKYDIIDN